ncbi:hypothetical protein AMAG_06298 [Allomyces macrogynus ATCC 38327]|uniref:Signal peptidase complex subunit 2 n=1 Tax=Allomyces macrogynus (strain ATCC 38327) TaxID=578462 RepID=A0A0L0SGA8_ALLM3|nr:hypothetical protein AMAG_06298 [Allomyces macrogynus ATCC 38327]|eukprot:KNE61477.1 hypothetical protein AMAG_06298 [Allomyces macrogynus ATCC 38327]
MTNISTTMHAPEYPQSAFKDDHKRFGKVAPYAFHDYRHTLEDSIRDILEYDLEFDLSTKWTDFRIVLGFLASIIGIGGAVYGFLVPFHESKAGVTASVIAYLAVSAITTYITLFIEDAKVATGKRIDPVGVDPPVTLTVASAVDTAWPNCQLHLTFHARAGARHAEVRATAPLEQYFTTSGELIAVRFYRDVVAWIHDAVRQTGNE